MRHTKPEAAQTILPNLPMGSMEVLFSGPVRCRCVMRSPCDPCAPHDPHDHHAESGMPDAAASRHACNWVRRATLPFYGYGQQPELRVSPARRKADSPICVWTPHRSCMETPKKVAQAEQEELSGPTDCVRTPERGHVLSPALSRFSPEQEKTCAASRLKMTLEGGKGKQDVSHSSPISLVSSSWDLVDVIQIEDSQPMQGSASQDSAASSPWDFQEKHDETANSQPM